MINRASPNILFVGLGAPKQEKWMAKHCGRLNGNVMVGVGAAFDFISGEKKQAPKWMQSRGLEWLFRLLSEPTRLWARYIVYNPLFVILFGGQLIRARFRIILGKDEHGR
jgi:N-acetylglucosaminyldiphosphoundecaprenol N-acetyl-beta-D-mannosaminyltransferase